MKPVTVSVTVRKGREAVWRYLDVLANHELFTNHMLVDWTCSGPPAGVGARARMRLKKPGRPDWIDLEVIEAEPYRSVEESVSAGGRRRTRGTYVLDETPDGGTRISFCFSWLELPLPERLAAPLTRAVVRRGNATSLRRLAALLEPPAGRSPRAPTEAQRGHRSAPSERCRPQEPLKGLLTNR